MTAHVPRYAHPKILLMDMEAGVEEALRAAGYQAKSGSFGAPIGVPARLEHVPVPISVAAPNDTEQEIVVIDSGQRMPVVREPSPVVEGETVFWQSASRGIVDPGPLSMVAHRARSFDRILDHGGVFICFVGAEQPVEYLAAYERHGELQGRQAMNASNWSFLSVLAHVNRDLDRGREITLTGPGGEIPGLGPALRDASFDSTFAIAPGAGCGWAVLARSKYGATVAAVLTRPEGGAVFLLPRVKEKASLVLRLVTDFLPGFAGQLYPGTRGSAWVEAPPYELPEIGVLRAEIDRVEATGARVVNEIETRIERKRQERSFLYELLTATGTELVTAVKRTLELLGFEDVRDVDAEAGGKSLLREDLQIRGREPILLVEVKGIGGLPTEADALQVDRYVVPRAEEWGHPEVRGLTVMNHQRGKPALERERRHVFQDGVIANANARRFGLLTTWELFRLTRNHLRLGWAHDQVADLFYAPGVIQPVPSHYRPVGTIGRFFGRAGALTVDLTAPIARGDTLAYELPIDFAEERVTSLQLGGAAVDSGRPGQEIGLATRLAREQARRGVRVFRVVKSIC